MIPAFVIFFKDKSLGFAKRKEKGKRNNQFLPTLSSHFLMISYNFYDKPRGTCSIGFSKYRLILIISTKIILRREAFLYSMKETRLGNNIPGYHAKGLKKETIPRARIKLVLMKKILSMAPNIATQNPLKSKSFTQHDNEPTQKNGLQYMTAQHSFVPLKKLKLQ